MSKVFWDTNLFVYLVEDRGERAERVAALRRRMIERDDELLTSALIRRNAHGEGGDGNAHLLSFQGNSSFQRWLKPPSTSTYWPVLISEIPYFGRGTFAEHLPSNLAPRWSKSKSRLS